MNSHPTSFNEFLVYWTPQPLKRYLSRLFCRIGLHGCMTWPGERDFWLRCSRCGSPLWPVVK